MEDLSIQQEQDLTDIIDDPRVQKAVRSLRFAWGETRARGEIELNALLLEHGIDPLDTSVSREILFAINDPLNQPNQKVTH